VVAAQRRLSGALAGGALGDDLTERQADQRDHGQRHGDQ
jgi:hypothetical protein